MSYGRLYSLFKSISTSIYPIIFNQHCFLINFLKCFHLHAFFYLSDSTGCWIVINMNEMSLQVDLVQRRFFLQSCERVALFKILDPLIL